MLLEKGKMITNKLGISYYQIGKKFYSNSGWLEREISKSEFEKEVRKTVKEIQTKTIKKEPLQSVQSIQ